jgi:hypothetical protein
MATTFTKIADVTVGSGGAASIDFTSIPSTFTDLVLKVSVRDTNAGSHIDGGIRLNGATTNIVWRRVMGNGAAASSATASGDNSMYGWIHNGAGSTANTFSNCEVYIPNYAGSSYKSVSFDSVDENNGTTAYADLVAGLWSSSTAVNQVTVVTSGTLFAQYSSATLYGISKS